jgi:hypothetical protein
LIVIVENRTSRPPLLLEIAGAATQQRLITMSQIVRGIFGAAAVALTLGAAQLASGGDLTQIGLQSGQSLGQDINRESKSDRAVVARQVEQGQTVSVKLVGQTILVRIPSEQLGEARRPPSLLKAPGARKTVFACEPVVSVLTELARQLQPGRCVT